MKDKKLTSTNDIQNAKEIFEGSHSLQLDRAKESQQENVSATNNIKELWNKLNTKEDLLNLINTISVEMVKETKLEPRFYTLQQLNYNAYSTNNIQRYISFNIPKKKQGEFRTIDAPNPTLKGIQQCLNYVFQELYQPHTAAFGFVPKRSIVDGAKVHLSQKYVYNIDLKDFFPSITAGRLYKRLQVKPFCLTAEIASIITDLCCYKNADGKFVLPQGAPTSPTITNFICERMDYKLTKLAKSYHLRYSRYADDITFSGAKDIFGKHSCFCKSLKHIIEEEEHFIINIEKTHLCHQGMRQEVTGLTINEKANVSRKYVKQLRTMIHNWEKDGYEKAQEEFIIHYHPTKNISGEHHIENIISGKLDFLKMVKGENDGTYRKLNKRFEKLLGLNEYQEKSLEEGKKESSYYLGDTEIMKVFEELNELLK